MWQVVCLFVLSMILSGVSGAMGAEADAKLMSLSSPMWISVSDFSGYSGYASAGSLLCKK